MMTPYDSKTMKIVPIDATEPMLKEGYSRVGELAFMEHKDAYTEGEAMYKAMVKSSLPVEPVVPLADALKMLDSLNLIKQKLFNQNNPAPDRCMRAYETAQKSITEFTSKHGGGK